MRHHDDHDIIGDRPKKTAAPVDELPLWSGAVDCTPAEAAATLEARFVRPAAAPADPQPAPRAKDETQAFAGDGPVSDVELERRRDRIREAVRQPLLDRAYLRRDLRERKTAGVTAADVREIAASKGLERLVGKEQRAWSWLPTWLNQLAREGLLVKWQHDGQTMKRTCETNGNDQAIYLDPYAAVLKAVA